MPAFVEPGARGILSLNPQLVKSERMQQIVPVALFAYSRPQHLLKTLDALKRSEVRLIHAFSDGPKDPSKQEAVDRVRRVLHSVDWCDIHIHERDRNLGLGASICTGVSTVLEHHDRVMVVEDDIVIRPGAYRFTADALERYAGDPRVMTVSMWSHPSLVPPDCSGGFFSKRFVCWGWGTYRNAWLKHVGTPLELFRQCTEKGLRVLDWGTDIRWQAEHAAERNLWYVGYLLTHFLYGGVSFFPAQSLTVNIGFDGSGENNGATGTSMADLLHLPVSVPGKWPDVVVPPDIEKSFHAYFSPRKPLLRALKKAVRKVLQRRPRFGR